MNKLAFYEEKLAKTLMYLSVLVVVYCVVSVIGAILQRGLPVLSWQMVSEVPGGGFFIGGKGGFLNAIVGSLYIVGGSTILGLLIALPVVFSMSISSLRRALLPSPDWLSTHSSAFRASSMVLLPSR